MRAARLLIAGLGLLWGIGTAQAQNVRFDVQNFRPTPGPRDLIIVRGRNYFPQDIEWVAADVEGALARAPGVVEELCLRSVAVKAGIVSRDERESGERALLNFGHTLGHALEAEGGFARLTHGEAVSLGMVAMLRVGEALGVTDPAEAARVVALLDRLGLPVRLDPAALRAALPFLALDKKRRGGAIRAVLLTRIGEARIHPLPAEAFPGLLGIG